MIRNPFTLLIHIALAVILAGAIVTHYCGIQGELVLSEGHGTSTFTKKSGPGDGNFPFHVRLVSAEIEFYPGTTTPMDFRSHLEIADREVTVSMNKVAETEGWRFYQSGISPGATRLTVSHDPWGTGITYTGYALLFIAMAGFLFQRKTPWRFLLKTGRKAAMAIMLFCSLTAHAENAGDLPAMQRPLAANMGKVYVYWNGRICPLQTMAKDVTLKLYGATSYHGLTAEQVLSGWLFYFDTWVRDYKSLRAERPSSARQQKLYDERLALVNWLGTGDAFKIYPYRATDGHLEWLSLTGWRPSGMSLEQWEFMQTAMPEIKALLLEGRNIDANKSLEKLLAGQIKYAGQENLPSAERVLAERIYNRYVSLLPSAILSLLIGVLYLYQAVKGRQFNRWLSRGTGATGALLLLYISSKLALLWWIGDHVPLSNGSEMMLCMGFFSLICALASRNRMQKGAFFIVTAMTLFVGIMGGRSPRIGMLMPVLSSPLLSVHVMLVMSSYVFFLIMAILAAVGLSAGSKPTAEVLCRTNRIILVPAVFLLAAGIFIGAVWANQSWGRYWGWDSKETCALVMLIVYSVPLHWGTGKFKAFRNPKVLHWYLLFAVLTVVFTYFGANYFLTGLHSYA